MSTTTIGTHPSVAVTGRTAVKAVPRTWLSWAGLIASAAIATGVYWDISWHMTIGRDSFWTPAHLLIQFGAIVAGLASSLVIFRTTFAGSPQAKQASVNVLGFLGPLSAFILAWGGAAMLTSAPFDDWWHRAYGLDVKIVSPPHMLLALGILAINWGAVFLTVAQMNRASGRERKVLEYLLLATGGFIVLQTMTIKLENTQRVFQHSGISYLVISMGLLLILESLARVTGHRWARTIMTGVYTVFCLLMLWGLPLFSAQPKLGPVYQDIKHMVPLPFPILLIVPAFFLDLVWPKIKNAGLLAQTVFGGVAYLAILIAVQWPAAAFLMSPSANNWFFANNNFPYFALPESPEVRHIFVRFEATDGLFWTNMLLAFAASVLSMGLGVAFGEWLKKVKR